MAHVTNLLFKELGYTLGSLPGGIALGIAGIPEVLKPFVCKNAKGRGLIDSPYRDQEFMHQCEDPS